MGCIFCTRGTVCKKYLPFNLRHRIAIFIQLLVNRRFMIRAKVKS